MGIGVLGGVWSLSLESFPVFLASFMLLFVATGVGNGSTYRMIPSIFHARAMDEGFTVEAVRTARCSATASP